MNKIDIDKDFLKYKENYENKIQLNKDKNQLNKDIKERLKTCENYERKIIEYVLMMNDDTYESFKTKEWLWNNGALRTLEEVNDFNKSIEDEYFRNNDGINKSVLFINILYIIPIILWGSTFIGCLKCDSAIFIILWVFSLPLMILSFIGISLFKSTLKIEEAEEHGIPLNDKSISKDVANIKYAKISIPLSMFGTYRHAKNATKDFLNPDTWSEFK